MAPGFGRDLLDEQIVVLARFDERAVLADLGADVLVLVLVAVLERLHRRIAVAALGQDQLGEAVARAGGRRRAE
jgi:hypothetical protein